MHVININSSIDISFSQKSFVKEILNYTNDYFYPFYYKRINLLLLDGRIISKSVNIRYN
jgi:hypothetical protein